MRCSKAREFISDALDSRLGESHALDLSRHLGDCPDCLRHQQVLTDGRALLRQEMVEPPENFEWKVQLGIQQALREKAAPAEPVAGWRFWRPARASAAGVAAVVLVAGGLMLAPADRSPSGPDATSGSFRVADSPVEEAATARPDLSGGVRRQPLRINTASDGFGIRTVADEGFVNRSPFPDPFEGHSSWSQNAGGGSIEVRKAVDADGNVYFIWHRRSVRGGGNLKLELQRSTLQEAGPAIPAGERERNPD